MLNVENETGMEEVKKKAKRNNSKISNRNESLITERAHVFQYGKFQRHRHLKEFTVRFTSWNLFFHFPLD